MIDSVGKMTNRFKPIKRTLKELIHTLTPKEKVDSYCTDYEDAWTRKD